MQYLILSTILLLSSWGLRGQSGPKEVPADLASFYNHVIAHHPDITSQQLQYQCAQADRQVAKGQFDFQMNSDLSYNYNTDGLYTLDPRVDIIGNDLKTHHLNLSSGISRSFRSGISASTSFNYSRTANNYPFTNFNEEVGSYVSDNYTSLNLSLSYPLLRNNGQDIITAGERLADIEIEVRGSYLETTISQTVYTMSLAYWDYVLTSGSLEAYRTNEQRIKQLLQMTRDLVEADRKPQSDLIQLEADLSDKQRQTIRASQQHLTAKNNLGRAIGLDTETSQLLSAPLNDFPEIIEVPYIPDLDRFLTIARRERPDLRALEQSLESYRIYKKLSDNDVKPQLDLTAFTTYSGIARGNQWSNIVNALGQKQGQNYQTGMGLTYTFPINNNRAKGAQIKAALQLQDRQILLENQIRNIELNIGIAYANLKNSVQSVRRAASALTYYQKVYDNEQLKFRSGLTTMLNVIIFQERLTFAELDYLQAQHQYASAISELRYRTGSNYLASDISGASAYDIFYTLPQ